MEILWSKVVWKWLVGEPLSLKDLTPFSLALVNWLSCLEEMNEDVWHQEYGGIMDYLCGLDQVLPNPKMRADCLDKIKRSFAMYQSSSVSTLSLSFSISQVFFFFLKKLFLVLFVFTEDVDFCRLTSHLI